MTKPAKSASVGGLGAPLSRFCAAPAGAGAAAAAAGAPLWPSLAAFPGYPPLFVQHLLSLQAAGTSLFAAAADTADDEPLNLTVSGADRDRVKATTGERTNGKLQPPQPAQRVSPTGQKDRPVKKRKGSPEEPEGKRKKARTTFTGHQIFELERQFEIKRYLASAERTEMAKRLDVTETQVKIWFQNRRTKWKKAEQEAAAAQKAATERQSATTGQSTAAEAAATPVTEGKQSTETSSRPASDGQTASGNESANSKQTAPESATEERTAQPTVNDAEKSSDGVTDGSEKSVDSPVEVTNSETDTVDTSAPAVSTSAAEDVTSMEVTSQNPEVSSERSPSPTSSGDGEATNSAADCFCHSSRDSTPAPPSGPALQTLVHSPADGGATLRPVAGRLLTGALGVGPAGRPRSGIAKLERLVFQREREAALCGES